jgi:hypothetical protein
MLPNAGSTYNQLSYVTRRAFTGAAIVQVGQQTPLLSALIGTAKMASGGVSQITQPVQVNQMTLPQWAGYGGQFTGPQDIPGMQNAEWNLTLMIDPIPFLGMEGLVQNDYAVVPLLAQRFNSAIPDMRDTLGLALVGNTSNNVQLGGLPWAIDDGTNNGTWGNLSRTGVQNWQSKVYNAGGANPTRSLMVQYVNGTFKFSGGEMPSYGICGIGTWTLLEQDFQAQETFMVTPGSQFGESLKGASTGFRALMVGGVPIYCDPYVPEGTLYLINHKYVNLFIHELAQFAFTGFESTLPNNALGFVGAVIFASQLVNTKPKSCTRVGGLASAAI